MVHMSLKIVTKEQKCIMNKSLSKTTIKKTSNWLNYTSHYYMMFRKVEQLRA